MRDYAWRVCRSHHAGEYRGAIVRMVENSINLGRDVTAFGASWHHGILVPRAGGIASRCHTSETLKVFETGAVSREVSRSRRTLDGLHSTHAKAHRAALQIEAAIPPLNLALAPRESRSEPYVRIPRERALVRYSCISI